ncbi:spinster family MFS transporter [Novosphingobium decolorationis]|uniref:MFS transporter n=1 Tax=Novosphingobium decolorationis TaxID=2698673 RepID=A0ABX8E711_9SPHN|nr:MFS transporter [Novosphingobium decolorationis]QVM84653.1 MFS transporter [Novosphingobium decolorationis]
MLTDTSIAESEVATGEGAVATGAPPELPGMAYRAYVLALLTLISALSAVDRQILDILVEPIRADFGLSDGQLGALNGIAYAGVYALAVIPLARLADRYPRKIVIAAGIVIWSLATTASSLARNFTHLFVARMGVGLGEGGLSSPGPALLSDLFPRHQRGTVTSIYMTGPAIGMGLAYAIGGYVVAAYGWRAAFLVAGLPGLVLAALFYLTVRNVPKGLADGLRADPPQPGLGRTLKAIAALRTILWMIVALACLALMVNGLLRWIPAYLTRTQGLAPVEFGAWLGAAVGTGSFVGHLVGGPLADWVGRRDPRRQMGIGIAASLGAALTIVVLFNAPSMGVFYGLAGFLSFTGGIFAAPLIMVCTTLPPVWARATTAAMTLMAVYLVGYGFGPALLGVLSDALAPSFGEDALRIALLSSTVLALPATFSFAMAARHYRADLAQSERQLARDAGRTDTPHPDRETP